MTVPASVVSITIRIEWGNFHNLNAAVGFYRKATKRTKEERVGYHGFVIFVSCGENSVVGLIIYEGKSTGMLG